MPSAPLAATSRSFSESALNRMCWATMSCRLADFAARIMALASFWFMAMGFSTSTFAPASSDAMVAGAWKRFCVHTSMMSKSPLFSIRL